MDKDNFLYLFNRGIEKVEAKITRADARKEYIGKAVLLARLVHLKEKKKKKKIRKGNRENPCKYSKVGRRHCSKVRLSRVLWDARQAHPPARRSYGIRGAESPRQKAKATAGSKTPDA